MHVFIVISTGFSENTAITEIRGVFAHMHQTSDLVRYIREAEGNQVIVRKHRVMDAPGIPPGEEGVQTDPSVDGIRAMGRGLVAR